MGIIGKYHQGVNSSSKVTFPHILIIISQRKSFLYFKHFWWKSFSCVCSYSSADIEYTLTMPC